MSERYYSPHFEALPDFAGVDAGTVSADFVFFGGGGGAAEEEEEEDDEDDSSSLSDSVGFAAAFESKSA